MILRQNLDGSRQALFSDDMAYRYSLLIRWDDSLPMIASIGLNPSKADEFRNDPTVTREIIRAKALMAGALLKLNLFAFIATNPKEMLAADDPYGEWRDPNCIIEAAGCGLLIAAWGNYGSHLGRSREFIEGCRKCGRELWAYKVNEKTGEPAHPLYLPFTLTPQIYQWSEVSA